MKELEDRIVKDGKVYPGNILKVDSFLNHQIDPVLIDHIAKELHRIYKDAGITKVLTIEASGIAIAIMAAHEFQVPAVFAKKQRSHNIGKDIYTSMVHSFTYDKDYPIALSKAYLQEGDVVLIVDDFLANGQAMKGLIDICHQAGAKVGGISACIEKGFQPGGDELRSLGYPVHSLAIVESMENGTIQFR